MYNSISNYIIEKRISNGKMSYEDYDPLDYKIKGYMSSIITTLLVITIGILFKCFFEVLIIGLIFNILKPYAFYHHFNSLETCSLFSFVYTFSLALISKYTSHQELYTFFICILLFIFTLKNVPNIPEEDKSKSKSKSDKEYRIIYIRLFLIFLTIDSLCIYMHNDISLIISNSISMGIISVELFLTKNGYQLFQIIDKITFKTRKGETD